MIIMMKKHIKRFIFLTQFILIFSVVLMHPEVVFSQNNEYTRKIESMGGCGIVPIFTLQEQNKTFYTNQTLEARRPECVDLTNFKSYPHPFRSGYSTNSEFSDYETKGYEFPYHDLLIRDGHIFINPFKNINGASKESINPLYHINVNNFTHADQKPGSLFINVENNNNERVLAFSKEGNTQHYFSTAGKSFVILLLLLAPVLYK